MLRQYMTALVVLGLACPAPATESSPEKQITNSIGMKLQRNDLP